MKSILHKGTLRIDAKTKKIWIYTFNEPIYVSPIYTLDTTLLKWYSASFIKYYKQYNAHILKRQEYHFPYLIELPQTPYYL